MFFSLWIYLCLADFLLTIPGIRDYILSNGKCVCGVSNVLADDLLPNKTLRDAIRRLLETTTATSSAEHGGSMQQPQGAYVIILSKIYDA